jgi:hypothetical protein
VAKTLKGAGIAVTHLQCRRPNRGLTDPIPIEDAYLVGFHYEDCLDHELWIDGKAVQKQGANLLLRSSIPMAGRVRFLLQIGQDQTSPCPSGLALNQSTSFLVRRGYLDPSYVFMNLTDLSASFYLLAMVYVPPRDLSSQYWKLECA